MKRTSAHGMIETFSGGMIDPLNPTPGAICIEDIAHALSNVCRFTGHTKRFYSVAQHSIIVASILPAPLKLWGLLHDASEAYIADVARPVKRRMPEYIANEKRLMQCICAKFDLEWPTPNEVDEADLRALATERRDLMPGNEPPWVPLDVEPLENEIVPWPACIAELRFLEQARHLGV